MGFMAFFTNVLIFVGTSEVACWTNTRVLYSVFVGSCAKDDRFADRTSMHTATERRSTSEIRLGGLSRRVYRELMSAKRKIIEKTYKC